MADAPKTILLVEDEPAIRQLLAVALERAGYRVLEARHGREALSIFEQEGDIINLLLTDIRMPYVGGQELIARLRAQRPSLKVLTISGYSQNAPADPNVMFIAKPFPREVLLKAVRDVLDNE
jgi:two-component system cell cycle sensor histidine kinase/response regulator CckA